MENYLFCRSQTSGLERLRCSDNNSSPLSCSSSSSLYIGEPKLIAIIGDEDTCVGFILAGIGQANEELGDNFIVVDPKMDDFKLELMFLDMLARPDIGLVLITKEAAKKISNLSNRFKGINPTILIIPGHNGPFEIDLPMAVKDIEERRKSSAIGSSRKGSTCSTTSIKTNESVQVGNLSRKVSTHSLRSAVSS